MTKMPRRFHFLERRVPFKYEAGTAVIELAITLIFLLLLTVGITEIGRAFWYYSAMQKATRDGARCLSNLNWVGGADVGGCRTLVRDNANSSGLTPQLALGNITAECDGVTCTWGTGNAPQYVTVTVVGYQIRWLWSLGIGVPAAGSTSSMRVTTTMPYMQ